MKSFFNKLKFKRIVFNLDSGWVDLATFEYTLIKMGFDIYTLDRHNRTDGEYHKAFKKGGAAFELHSNIYSADLFWKDLTALREVTQ